MIKTIMNVCVKFANDKDSNRANVELLVPKMLINSEMGCTKATRLQLLADRAQFALTREHFELIANERGERINLYSKDPIILKCVVKPYEKYFENGYLMHYFKIKFSESITPIVSTLLIAQQVKFCTTKGVQKISRGVHFFIKRVQKNGPFCTLY